METKQNESGGSRRNANEERNTRSKQEMNQKGKREMGNEAQRNRRCRSNANEERRDVSSNKPVLIRTYFREDEPRLKEERRNEEGNIDMRNEAKRE